MTISIKHQKNTGLLPDWTQTVLDDVIAGNAPPLPPSGTLISNIVLPSDFAADHVIDTAGASDGDVLTVVSGAAEWATPTGGTPAGSNTQIQFNNSGAFGADSNLAWNNVNKRLSVGTSQIFTLSNVLYNAVAGTESISYTTGTGAYDFVINNPNAQPTGLTIRNTGAGTWTWRMYMPRESILSLHWSYQGTDRMTLDTSGNLAVTGGISFAGNLAMGALSITGISNSLITLYDGASGHMFIRASNASTAISRIQFQTGTTTTTRMTLDGDGNLFIGTGVLAANARLQIRGSTADTTAWALRTQNSASSPMFSVRNDGNIYVNEGAVISGALGGDSQSLSAACGLRFRSNYTLSSVGSDFFFRNQNGSRSSTSGASYLMEFSGAYAPTSGTGTYANVYVTHTINQTGGANGITRGVWVNPVLTAAADYRSFETNNNTGFAFFGAGTAPSRFNGDVIEASNTRVTSDFSITNSTTFANVTGLTYNVVAGATYAFKAVLFTTSNSASGVKATISGTCTATNIVYAGWGLDGTTVIGTRRRAALDQAVGDSTTAQDAIIYIDGTITVNTAGTLTVQFAQNVAGLVASTVFRGSTFQLKRIT